MKFKYHPEPVKNRYFYKFSLAKTIILSYFNIQVKKLQQC